MSDRFSIEVRRRTVGIAVRMGGAFKFFAAEPRFFALEGKSYPNIRAVIADANATARSRDNEQLGRADTRHLAGMSESVVGTAASTLAPLRPVPTEVRLEEPPEWFRWAVCIGVATGPAMLATVAAALAG